MAFTDKGHRVVNNLEIALSMIDTRVMNYTAGIADGYIPQTVRTRIVATGMGYNDESEQPQRFTPYSSRQHISKREKKGLNVGFKDFSFSGEMWQSLMQVDKQLYPDGTGFVIRYGMTGVNPDADRQKSRGKMNEDIMMYHSEREGFSIMQLTPNEVLVIEEKIVNEVEAFLYSLFE